MTAIDNNKRMGVQVSKPKVVVGATILIVWIVIGALTMLFAKLVRWRALELAFPTKFHGFVARLFRLDTETGGVAMHDGATLFVSNHISYMDVFVLGALLKGSFVAKSEVSGWPVFGKLAALQNTLFLERRASKAREQVQVVRRHLDTKGNLIMFPEGTSTAGDHVAPFRSSLFAAAEGVTIQPVTIAYVSYEGEPMDQETRNNYAWYLPEPKEPVPNKPFLNHFLDGLGLKHCQVRVIFHPSTTMDAWASRKECAQYCEERVREGLESVLGKAQDVEGVEGAELAAGS